MRHETPNTQLIFRQAANRDCDGVIALIDRVYREYGDHVCLERADNDLLDLESSYPGGMFRVLEDSGQIVGSVALATSTRDPRCAFLKRLYLDATLRGSGWGLQLLEWAMQTARDAGMTRMEFWSDTRFTRSHAFYEKLGFRRGAATRTVEDAWEPYDEFYFQGDL